MNNIFSHKKLFFAVSATVLLLSVFVANNVLASIAVADAKVNGARNITVEGSTPILATVSVVLTDESVWRSTAYRFGEGEWVCVNTSDHLGVDVATESFSIITPAKASTTDVHFQAYERDDCTNSLPIVVASASLLTALKDILNFENNQVWVFALLLILVIIIIVWAAYYLIKRSSNKKI